jgi:hypothetical protein
MLLLGCVRPTLTQLDVATGPEHTVVMVQGDNLGFAQVVWDAGLESEKNLPGGFFGAYLFSVPPGASSEAHPVAVQNPWGRSKTVNFTVTKPLPYGPPRIDHVVMTGATSFDAGGNIEAWLYVQGANLDVGSVIQIDGVDVATVSHKALRNDLLGVDPTLLGFPIYHYVAVVAVMSPKPVGSSISLVARNLDGQVSAAFAYQLPVSAANLDSDGDTLLDAWEKDGFDANGDGTVDIDLAALGCNPFRRDLLLEVDVMSGLANPPIATAGGVPGCFDLARAMFAAAPVINPGTGNGINLILDTSGSVPFSSVVDFGVADDATLGVVNFLTLKAVNFNDAMRGAIYHYGIWANARANGSSGKGDVDFDAGTGGDDFIVSFDDFPASFQAIKSQVETLVHEFGHNLGQRHGGDTHSTLKPNYWSAMSYTWQLRTGRNNATRQTLVTCQPFYYGVAGATEPNGALPAAFSNATDYSEGMAASLVENNNTLRETVGVCGQVVDWNNDGDQTDDNINADADDNGDASDTLHDFANWRALVFTGPASNGTQPPPP